MGEGSNIIQNANLLFSSKLLFTFPQSDEHDWGKDGMGVYFNFSNILSASSYATL
jgi:hypothetical protein